MNKKGYFIFFVTMLFIVAYYGSICNDRTGSEVNFETVHSDKTYKDLLGYKTVTSNTGQQNSPPAKPVLISPKNNSIVTQPIVISWECSDPDNDTLTYTVRIRQKGFPLWQGSQDAGTEKYFELSGIPETVFGIPIEWQVIASDGKSQSFSDIWIVIVCGETTKTEYVSICEGENYNGWNETGTYYDTVTYMECKSIKTTYLTVHPKYFINTDTSICEGMEYKGWKTEGKYIEYYFTASGCDSTVFTDLHINPLPVKPDIVQKGDTLISGKAFGYSWYLNDTLIPGADSNELIINTSGFYRLAVSNEHGCNSELSDPLYAIRTAANKLESSGRIRIYPNPTTGKVKIDGLNRSFISEIIVYDNGGRTIFSDKVKKGTVDMDFSGYKSGIYIIRVNQANNSAEFQLLKN